MGQGMSEILPGLLLGSFRDSKDKEQLDKYKISHVLAIHDNAKPLNKGMKYLCLISPDKPHANIIQFFEESVLFIHKCRTSGGSVLIHCIAGISRSTTLTVAYLMTLTDYSWLDCVRAIRHLRPVAMPNFGFQKQLQEYQHTTLKEVKVKLKELCPDYPVEKDVKILKKIVEQYYKTQEAKQAQYETSKAPVDPTQLEDFIYPLPYKAYTKDTKESDDGAAS